MRAASHPVTLVEPQLDQTAFRPGKEIHDHLRMGHFGRSDDAVTIHAARAAFRKRSIDAVYVRLLQRLDESPHEAVGLVTVHRVVSEDVPGACVAGIA